VKITNNKMINPSGVLQLENILWPLFATQFLANGSILITVNPGVVAS